MFATLGYLEKCEEKNVAKIVKTFWNWKFYKFLTVQYSIF